MKITIQHSITLNNKKYSYSIKKIDKNTSFVECKAANITQEFLNEDIPKFLNDLPHLILAEKTYHDEQNEIIRFRVSSSDKKLIEKQALKRGFSSVSSFLRALALGK